MMPEDIGEVYKITCASLDQYFDPNVFTFFRMQWPRGQLVASDACGRIIGYIIGSRLDGGRASIAMFAVSDMHRSKGVGSRLLSAFRARAVSEGMMTMVLEVRSNNQRAMDFYKRHGFMVVEFLPSFYTDCGDAVRMSAPTILGN
jgi:[ribosomal protein S18]-alanine N-acetyltransferase